MSATSPTRSNDELIPVTIGEEKSSSLAKLTAFTLIPFVIGFGIAEAIHRASGFDMYVQVTDNDLRPRQLYYLYFSAVLFSWLCRWLNMYPAGFKNAAVGSYGKAAKGNIRANMYLYTLAHKSGESSLVVMEEGGAAGQYNRANRSLHHFVENAIGAALCLPLAGFVYPAASFIVTILFALGRVWHQMGYTVQGYGGHGAGFGISLVATVILEGLTAVAGLRAAGVPL